MLPVIVINHSCISKRGSGTVGSPEVPHTPLELRVSPILSRVPPDDLTEKIWSSELNIFPAPYVAFFLEVPRAILCHMPIECRRSQLELDGGFATPPPPHG